MILSVNDAYANTTIAPTMATPPQYEEDRGPPTSPSTGSSNNPLPLLSVRRWSAASTLQGVDSNFTSVGDEFEVALPDSDLPTYVTALPAPTTPQLYTFTPNSPYSMLLTPPRHGADPNPLFHISVAANCFNPTSHVTTVRRGSSMTSPPIGEFEMGISQARATVTIGDRQQRIDSTLTKTVTRGDYVGVFTWTFGNDRAGHLVWEWKGNILSCYQATPDGPRSHSNVPYATYVGPPLEPREDGRRPPPAAIKVEPAAFKEPTLSHIIISLLIIERRRLEPASSKTKHIFM